MLAGLGFCRESKRRFVTVLVLWCLFTAVFVEEARSLLGVGSLPSETWIQAHQNGRGIRVVSLNCAGNVDSLQEIAKWKPDIVLLQESPGSTDVAQFAQELFGDQGKFLYGHDTSIIAAGKIISHAHHLNSRFVHAEVELLSGLQLDVVSLRLSPPVFRLDFWTPGFWIDHRNKRIKHREQISDLMQHLETVSVAGPIIIGGDFNSPPHDAAMTAMRPRLHDTFSKAGCGWGATGTSEYPLFRVDQIWASQEFRAASVTAQKTVHSDHRAVICDLVILD